jgi:hypothetical protein
MADTLSAADQDERVQFTRMTTSEIVRLHENMIGIKSRVSVAHIKDHEAEDLNYL